MALTHPLLPRPLGYSGRVRDAMRFTYEAHLGVFRKTGDFPYFLHTAAAAQIMAAAGGSDDELIAALTHDVPEDTRYTLWDLVDRVGHQPAVLVAYVTKQDFDAAGRRRARAERNRHTRETLRTGPIEAAALKGCDLAVNTSDLIVDRRELGADHWQEIFGDKLDEKIGHYIELGEMLCERLIGTRYDIIGRVLEDRIVTLTALHYGATAPRTDARLARHAPLVYSGRVRAAGRLAERVLRGQARAGTDYPFFLHPVSHAQVLTVVGADDDLIIAAYLEDAVDKGLLSLSEVHDTFGQRPARLIAATASPNEPGMSSADKDRETLARMPDADADEQAVKGGDALVNITDLVCDHHQLGAAHWSRVFGDRLHAKLDYYDELARVLACGLATHGRYKPLADELAVRAEQLAELRGS